MTDAKQLEGPELWLAVAQVMGASNPTIVAGEVYCSFPCKPYVRFDPPTNPTDAWAMHQYVRGLGLELHYMDGYEDSVVTIYRTFDCSEAAQHSGPDDETALGRAIEEMGNG